MSMHPILCAVVGAVVGAVLTFTLMTAGAGTGAPTPVSGETDAQLPVTGVATRAPVADLQPVLDRLDALQREITQLRNQRGIPASVVERVEVADANARGIDIETVIAAFDEIERRKLDGMTAEDLIRSARQLRKNIEDRAEAIRRLEVALTREMTSERRGEMMVTLGVWHRERNTPAALAASERSFQSVVDRHGLGSALGRNATYQLIWTVDAQGDQQRALEFARLAVNSVGAPNNYRYQARWAEAVIMEKAGRKEQARIAYRQLLSEVREFADMKWITEDLEKRLSRK